METNIDSATPLSPSLSSLSPGSNDTRNICWTEYISYFSHNAINRTVRRTREGRSMQITEALSNYIFSGNATCFSLSFLLYFASFFLFLSRPYSKLRREYVCVGNIISRVRRRSCERERRRSRRRRRRGRTRRRREHFLLSRGRVAMGKGSSDGPELGVIRLGGCLDVN